MLGRCREIAREIAADVSQKEKKALASGGCNGKGYPERTNFHDAPCFQNSRLKLAVFCVLLSETGPISEVRANALSDPKIRAGKFNIFALTRAVL